MSRAPLLTTLLLLLAPALAGAAGADGGEEGSPGRLVADYARESAALGLADPELSYRGTLQALIQDTPVEAQRRVFEGFARRLEAVAGQPATPCERLDLAKVDFEVHLHLEKLALVERFRALGPGVALSGGGLHGEPLGHEWYRYLLRRWLGLEVTPERLLALGEAELERALGRYRELQGRMGYAGRDQAFAAYLAGPAFRYPGRETPRADYEARQAVVYRNLGALFLPTRIQPALIRQSAAGASLPVDAYYEPAERTFYFNRARAHFERRSLDWLLLHESTPGHHFQLAYAAERAACPRVLPRVPYPGFSEGWAAYVEEHGKALGLYRTDADALGAVEWDLVRSIRVILDVGLNELGWTEAQALELWRRRLPMVPDLAQREIDRVRAWPAQAITYKQGAVVIRELRRASEAALGDRFDLRAFHDRVLRHGAVPLALLPGLVLDPADPPRPP